jgi:hypothetical protein
LLQNVACVFRNARRPRLTWWVSSCSRRADAGNHPKAHATLRAVHHQRINLARRSVRVSGDQLLDLGGI